MTGSYSKIMLAVLVCGTVLFSGCGSRKTELFRQEEIIYIPMDPEISETATGHTESPAAENDVHPETVTTTLPDFTEPEAGQTPYSETELHQEAEVKPSETGRGPQEENTDVLESPDSFPEVVPPSTTTPSEQPTAPSDSPTEPPTQPPTQPTQPPAPPTYPPAPPTQPPAPPTYPPAPPTQPPTPPTYPPAPPTQPPAPPTQPSEFPTQPSGPSREEIYDISDYVPGPLELAVMDHVNQCRAEAGTGSLIRQGRLCGIASVRAYEVSLLWSHTRPGDKPWDSVLQDYEYVSENAQELIARTTDPQSAERIVGLWMRKYNLLDSAFKSEGAGVYSFGGTFYLVLILTT